MIALILSLVNITLGANVDFLKYSCDECKANNGRLCLEPDNHLESFCCDPSEDVTDPSDPCFKSDKDIYCADATTPDLAFWDFACKA